MDSKELEALIGQVLDEAAPHAGAPPVDRAAVVARLAAGLGERAALPDESGDPTASLAAALDGGLGEAERDALEARLAADPVALHELAAGLAYLDALAAEASPAPKDLVEASLARLPPPAQAASRRRVRWLLQPWQWSGVVAVLLLAIVGTTLIGERAKQPFEQAAPPAPLVNRTELPSPAAEPAADATAPALAAQRSARCALEAEQHSRQAASMQDRVTFDSSAGGGSSADCDDSAPASAASSSRPAMTAPALPTAR